MAKLSKRAAEMRKKGLYEKFTVTRTDERSEPGEKHHGCRYFVLDLDHDPFAWAAIEAYEVACASTYPSLAIDLYKMRHVAMEQTREATGWKGGEDANG